MEQREYEDDRDVVSTVKVRATPIQYLTDIPIYQHVEFSVERREYKFLWT